MPIEKQSYSCVYSEYLNGIDHDLKANSWAKLNLRVGVYGFLKSTIYTYLMIFL